MKFTTILVAALSLALLGACDRGEPRPKTTSGSSPAASGSTTAPRNEAAPSTQNTPANAGTPSTAEKREGSNPVQGQVDPKQGAQHKDFQTGGK